MAATAAKTAAKVAIGAGAVYVTLSQGVWSTSTQGSKALTHVKTKVLPATNEYVEKIPSASDVNTTILSYWNYGVQKTFSGMAAAPETVSSVTKKAVSEVKQSLNPKAD